MCSRLGTILSKKHCPLGRTNLESFKRFGFRIGFAGVRNTSRSSEHSNGRVGSILGAGVSDVTKLETFFLCEDDAVTHCDNFYFNIG